MLLSFRKSGNQEETIMTKENNRKITLRKLKRAVIKEELVALTDDFKEAIVLNQLIYWSERVNDSDHFILEEMERERRFADGSVESKEDKEESLKNGWIYKTAEEMIEEVMLRCSTSTMDRIFKSLVDKKYISRRRNPKYKWDKTWQYRVNLNKIQAELVKIGYSLEGYNLVFPDQNTPGNEDGESKPQNEESNPQNNESKPQNGESNPQNGGAIPEITTETTSEITSNNFFEEDDELNLYKYKNLKNETSNPGKTKYDKELEESMRYRNLIRHNPLLKEISNLLLLSDVDPDKIIKIIVGIQEREINVDFHSAKAQLLHCEVKQAEDTIYDFPEYYLNGLAERCSNNQIKTSDYAPEGLTLDDVENVPLFNWLEQ